MQQNNSVSSAASANTSMNQCPTCRRTFRFGEFLLSHMLTHANHSDHVCHFCNKAFYSANSLKAHFKKHLRNKVTLSSIEDVFHCNVCEAKFTHKSDLWNHQKIHKLPFSPKKIGQSQNVCLICGQLFNSQRKLREHVAVHMLANIENEANNRESEGGKAQKIEIKTEPRDIDDDDYVGDDHTNDNDDEEDDETMTIYRRHCNNLIKDDPENYDESDANKQFSENSANQAFEEGHVGSLLEDVYKMIQAFDGDSPVKKDDKITKERFANLIASAAAQASKAGEEGAEWEKNVETTPDGRYKCPECPNTYGSRSGVRLHMWNHTGVKPYKCNVCDKSFGRIDYLRKHAAVHADGNDFVCKECGASYKTENSLNNHMQETHGSSLKTGRFQCPICPRTYGTKQSVREHMRTHTGSKPHQCPVCNKQFGRLDSLKKHAAVHSTVRYFVCGECGTGFKVKGSLRQHLQQQHGIPLMGLFLCEVCHKNYTSEESLTKHKETHTEEEIKGGIAAVGAKSFEDSFKEEGMDDEDDSGLEATIPCFVCGKMCTTSVTLHEHVQNEHTNATTPDGRYMCPQCPNTYCTRGALRQHVFNHTGVKLYKCTVCNKSFGRFHYLQRHKITHMEKPAGEDEDPENMRPISLSTIKARKAPSKEGERNSMCSECGMMFKTDYDVKKHMTVHQTERPWKCTECDWAFKRRYELDTHMLRHRGIHPYVCDLCGKGYCTSTELRAHNRIHSGEKPYPCKLCPATFSHINSLMYHKRKFHEKVKPFVCNKCPSAHYTKSALARHMLAHSSEKKHRCKDCGKAFKTTRDVKKHERNRVCLRGKSRNRTPDAHLEPRAPLPPLPQPPSMVPVQVPVPEPTPEQVNQLNHPIDNTYYTSMQFAYPNYGMVG